MSPAAETRVRHRDPGAGSYSRRRRIAEELRSRPFLARVVAAAQELRMTRRIAHRVSHRVIPAIRDWRQPFVQRRAQRCNDRGQRVGKVLVLAATETVATKQQDVATPVRCLRSREALKSRRARRPSRSSNRQGEAQTILQASYLVSFINYRTPSFELRDLKWLSDCAKA